MNEIILTTIDWVPEDPRGFVRGIRLRWACKEAGLAYSVQTIPFNDRGPGHLARQPFRQVPFLSDGELEIFESGAGLLHLARKSETLNKYYLTKLGRRVLAAALNIRENIVLPTLCEASP